MGGRRQGERRGVQAGTGSGGLSWGDGLWLTGEGGKGGTGTRLNRGDLWRGRGSQELGGTRRIQGGTRENSGAGRKLGIQGGTGRDRQEND